ncbi:hypothetical protein GALMADRAFT_139453 [Galerina marginata CBS 339.88]|uniref:Uncharacterized protein n=1 Tax=Galerina marginata (strain CBS 339.88) TaxID=685588 RepID=A0A067T086_GALM3|nr:hypothetical protein GALMADRAFT_139453 [Galerina marginata CBS 339.88]
MTVVGLDDRDPHISYWGDWFLGGLVGSEYNATTTGSNTIGDVASLTFTGTKVSIWGSFDADVNGKLAPTSAYILDNLPAVTFMPALQPETQFLQNFFQADELSPSSHTLIIKNMGTSSDSYLWLDYIQITLPDSVDAVLFSTPTPSSLTSSSPLPSTPARSAIPPPVVASSTPKSDNVPVGVIVGATLGGLAFLAIFAVTLVLYLRMKSKHHNKPTERNQQFQSSLQVSSIDFGRQPPQPSLPPEYRSSLGIPVDYAREHLPSSKVSRISAPVSTNQ